MEIDHYSHEHRLRLVDEEIKATINRVYCRICNRRVTASPFYVCDPCRYYLHRSCAESKKQLNHPFHPSHPLTLITDGGKIFFNHCNSCFRSFTSATIYRCKTCYFGMDIQCAMMPIETPSLEGRHIIHFSHPHSLLLAERHDVRCIACDSACAGESYGCDKCAFFLHKSCSELPQQIRLPSHLGAICSSIKDYVTCNVCNNYVPKFRFVFECEQCKLQMCVKCSYKVHVSRRNFKYADHEHPLCFTEEMCTRVSHCKAYDSYCAQHVTSSSKEFDCAQFFLWRCLDCDYVLHLLCGPLPSVIKSEWHVDPLTLVDSLAEEAFDEYYCDVCETERDRRIRVYCCTDCKFVAHVHCVIPEIIKLLTGEIEHNVELKSVGQDAWKVHDHNEDEDDPFIVQQNLASPSTVLDLINALSEEEQDRVSEFYRWDHKISKDEKKSEFSTTQDDELLADEEINEILQLSRFTSDVFDKLISDLNLMQSRKLELKSSDLSLTLVKVKGGYMIPRPLSDVLEKWINQYGDTGSHSAGPLEMKSFVFFILCQLLRRMRNTLVKDVTKNLLIEWFWHLRFVHRRGFSLKALAFSSLLEITPAFFGLQSKRLEDEIPAMLRKKIALLQLGLEKCREYRSSSPKSEYMICCLKKASELEWKHVLEALPERDPW